MTFGGDVLESHTRTPDRADTFGVGDVVHDARREASVAVADGDDVARAAAVVDAGEAPQAQCQRPVADVRVARRAVP